MHKRPMDSSHHRCHTISQQKSCNAETRDPPSQDPGDERIVQSPVCSRIGFFFPPVRPMLPQARS